MFGFRAIGDAQYFIERLSTLEHIDPPSSSVVDAAQQLTLTTPTKSTPKLEPS